MPNYVSTQKIFVKYKHEPPLKLQFCSYEPAPKKFGRESNEATGKPESPHVDDSKFYKF